MKNFSLLFLMLLAVLPSSGCPAGGADSPELVVVMSEKRDAQTRIYKRIDAKDFCMLCREFLSSEGYTVSFIDRVLLRAWKDREQKDSSHFRESIVLYITNYESKLKVRGQFSVKKIETYRTLRENKKILTDPYMYSLFFDRLDCFIGESVKLRAMK